MMQNAIIHFAEISQKEEQNLTIVPNFARILLTFLLVTVNQQSSERFLLIKSHPLGGLVAPQQLTYITAWYKGKMAHCRYANICHDIKLVISVK
jgi:hypothetical protein